MAALLDEGYTTSTWFAVNEAIEEYTMLQRFLKTARLVG